MLNIENIKRKFNDNPWEFMHPYTTIFLLSIIAYLVYIDIHETVIKVNAKAHYPQEVSLNQLPAVTPWNEKLENNMRVIAVSEDLRSVGLDNGTTVKIKGLKGQYVVVGQLENSPEKTVEIYMRDRPAKAEEWGEKKVNISFRH